MTNALKISKLKNFDSVMAFVAFAGATTLAVGCYHLVYGFGWSIGAGRASWWMLGLLVYVVILPLNFALIIVATFFHPLSWRIWLPAFLYLMPAAALIYEAQDLIVGFAWILHGTVSLAISIQWSKHSGRGSS